MNKKNDLRILALDLGQHLGAADWPQKNCWTVELEGSRTERLSQLMDWLEMWVEGYDVVAYERPFARGSAATRSLWGMAGVVEAVATRHGRMTADFAVTAIKRHATGYGSADKSVMIQAMDKLGWGPQDEHQADAAAVCQLAVDKIEVTG